MTVIRTRRLLLRPARPDDLDAMFAILSDPAAMAYWSSPPHANRDRTRDWLAPMIEAAESGAVAEFIVEMEGRTIGKAGFWKPPELGYILHPDAWGRGLGSEAVSAAIAFGFEALGLDSVLADVDPRNLASLALLARLGFDRVGFQQRTFEINGRWVDSVYMKLERGRFRPHLHREG